MNTLDLQNLIETEKQKVRDDFCEFLAEIIYNYKKTTNPEKDLDLPKEFNNGWNNGVLILCNELQQKVQELSNPQSQGKDTSCPLNCGCDCHAFIGGSGKPCPECQTNKPNSEMKNEN